MNSSQSRQSRLRLPPSLVRVAMAGHSTLGLGVAMLLYIIALSGTLLVFAPELDRVQQPRVPVVTQPTPALTQQALDALPGGLAAWRRVSMTYPSSALPRMILTASPAAGGGRQRFAADTAGNLQPLAAPWSAFARQLHERLMLRGVTGITLVGIVGVALLTLIFGGIIAHARLFRDAFVLRTPAGVLVRQADVHKRLAVWGLPFHIMIAFTGAAVALSMPIAAVVGQLGYGTNSAEMRASIIGPVTAAEPGSPGSPDIKAILQQIDDGDPAAIQRVIVTHPGQADQLVRVDTDRPQRLVYGDRSFFTAQGVEVTPGGMLDHQSGLSFFSGMIALHFGSFGGTALRVLYGLLGLGLCTVIASGVRIWLARQRARSRPRVQIERLWTAFVWGGALAFAVSYGGAVASVRLAQIPGTVFAVVLLAAVVVLLAAVVVALAPGRLSWLRAWPRAPLEKTGQE